VARAAELADQGADIIDVGGQSGVTGVPEVAAADEIERVLPVVRGIRERLPDLMLSVDTYKPPVVEAVLAAGASIINDVSGLRYPEVADLCARAGAGLVVMHNRSKPKERLTESDLYSEGGVTRDVVAMLRQELAEAVSRGLPAEAVIVDPGPDFSKTPHQTVTVLRELDEVRALGRPLLLPLSRKDFVGAITERAPRQRLAGTLAAIGHAVASTGGAGCILRVHDVSEVVDYLRVASVLAGRDHIGEDVTLAPHLRRQPPGQSL
jgi:dihydropteroate synthase